MILQTVIGNLRNTIAGKEAYLRTCHANLEVATMGEATAICATIEFLTVNIDELKRILADIESASQPVWNQYNCPFVENCHRID